MRCERGDLRLAQRDFRASYRENVVRSHSDARLGKFEIGLLHGDESILQCAIRFGSKGSDVLLRHIRAECFGRAGDISVGGDAICLRGSWLHERAGIDPVVETEIIARL